MNDRSRLLSGGLLLLLGVGGAVALFALRDADLSHSVEIPREQLQERLAKRFPLSKEALGLKLEIRAPEVVLEEGVDRIGMRAVVAVKQPGLELAGIQLLGPSTVLEGRLVLSGTLDYRPSEGVLYFVDPQLREVTVRGLPDRLLGPVGKLANDLLATCLARVAIHRFEGRNLKEKVARLLLKRVTVQGGKLVVVLGI